MRRDDLNDFHSVTHLIIVISNLEEQPSVRMQTRRLDGLKIRSEHGGEEENRIFQLVANNLVHYVTGLKFWKCVFNMPRECVRVCV